MPEIEKLPVASGSSDAGWRQPSLRSRTATASSTPEAPILPVKRKLDVVERVQDGGTDHR